MIAPFEAAYDGYVEGIPGFSAFVPRGITRPEFEVKAAYDVRSMCSRVDP